MKDVPSIVCQLRWEEEQGQLNSKNIYDHISNTGYSAKDEETNSNQNTTNDAPGILLKKITKYVSDPIFLQDGDYSVKWINKETQKTFIHSSTHYRDIPCYTLIFNKKNPCKFCPMKTAIQTGKSQYTQSTTENKTTWEITSIPLYANNHLIGVIQHLKTINDNTENQSTHQPLDPQQIHRTIIENAALGIIVLDRDLNHLTINPAFSGMTGFEQSEIKKYDSTPIYWPTKFTSEIKTEIQRLKQKGHLKMETYLQRKDRSLFPVSIVGSMFIDEHTKEENMILIIDDITKNKATERELKISQLLLLSLIQNLEKKVKERTQKIEQLLKQKNEFINQLGHDLKNPLGPLINLIPVLIKQENDEHKKQMLTVIQRNTNHMKNLITKTIELAQLNSGNINLHFESIDLTTALNNSIIRNNHHIKEKEIIIENNLTQSMVINADKIRIDELFDNLLTNALKYSPNQSVITITGSSTETTVSITIKDTGIGMNKQQLSHVFDEFYKADPARHDFKSSGLGTSICKRIVEKHGGHIKIESEGLGKGTKVTFTLQKSPSLSNIENANSTLQKIKSKSGEP